MTDTITESTAVNDFDILAGLDQPVVEEATSETDRWVPDPDSPVGSATAALDLLKDADAATLLRAHTHQLRIRSLMARIEETNRTILAERTEHQQWLAMVQETAHEHASESDWCRVADDCMEDLGFEARGPRTEEVAVDVEVTRTVEWEYTDTTSNIDNAIVAKVEADLGGTEVDLNSLQIRFQVTQKFSLTRTVDTGDCACGGVDRGDVADYLDISTHDIEDFSTDCSNC